MATNSEKTQGRNNTAALRSSYVLTERGSKGHNSLLAELLRQVTPRGAPDIHPEDDGMALDGGVALQKRSVGQ